MPIPPSSFTLRLFKLFKLLGKNTYSGLYQGFECNFRFLQNALFWAPDDNLGPKDPANSFKQVTFSAGFQGKPKHCRAIKVVKGP